MTTILYPYIQSEADGEELRLSLRSLAENLTGDYRPCIIGDIPAWYTGDAIPLPRITQNQYLRRTGKRFGRRWHYAVDQAWKYAAAGQCEHVTETFVIWYDETFVLSKMPIEYFLTARHIGQMPEYPKRPNAFWDAMIRTRKRLVERGLTTLDFDSHHPFPVCKSTLPEYYEEFDPLVSPASFPCQYLNWLECDHRMMDETQFEYVNREKCEDGRRSELKVANYGIVTPDIESWLTERFPNPSPWEKQ